MKFTIEIAQDNNEWDLYEEINPKLFKKIKGIYLSHSLINIKIRCGL